MLVLTRRASSDEHATVMIGDQIEVTILEVRGDQVRIGIKAPQEVVVDRHEIAVIKKSSPAKVTTPSRARSHP